MGKILPDNDINRDGHVRDLLSAYIDESLEEVERERVRAHIETCADCREDYVELRATVHMLHTMPTVALPRSFTLTPEMAARARKSSFWERLLSPRLAPTFATGSVMAFVLLFFVLVGTNLSANRPSETMALKQATDTSASLQASPTDGYNAYVIQQEPTSTTASAAGITGDSAGSQAQDTQLPGNIAPIAPATEATPLPDADGQVQPYVQGTPNTTISGSGNSSPTTVPTDGAFFSPGLAPPPESSTESGAGDRSSATQSQADQSATLVSAAEIGLLLLGVALGAAAIVARLRAL